MPGQLNWPLANGQGRACPHGESVPALVCPSLVFLDTDWAMGPQGGAQQGEGDRKPVYLG